jgi:hypothetical protein
MVSIGPFLRARGEAAASAGIGQSLTPWVELVARLLAGVANYAAPDDGARCQIAALCTAVQGDLPPAEIANIGQAVESLLAGFHAAQRQKDARTAAEIQHIVSLLREALELVATGSERSVSRLKTVAEQLQRTARIHDVTTLRSSLAATIRYAEEEIGRERDASTREMAALEEQTERVRRAAQGGAAAAIPGRPEGVRAISGILQAAGDGHPVFSVALLLDRLEGMTMRYGPAVGDELVLRLVRERLQPLAPESAAFRWNGHSLVGVFSGSFDLAQLRARMEELNRQPLVHRAAHDGRVALLRISPSHLVTKGTGSPDALIEELDRFTGVIPRHSG